MAPSRYVSQRVLRASTYASLSEGTLVAERCVRLDQGHDGAISACGEVELFEEAGAEDVRITLHGRTAGNMTETDAAVQH